MQHTPFLIFKGAEQMPFSAPRGIYLFENILCVSDTAQNRVLLWKSIPTSEHQEPDIILGKNSKNTNAHTLYYPSGVWTNGKKLIVADAWNHRVLIWHSFPAKNYQQADIVVGQKDFSQNLPNQNGVNTPCLANTLYWCYGIYSDGLSLWIADTGNRRVLYFENIPTQPNVSADQVIGQKDFKSRDFSPLYPTWPYSVKISRQNEMLITDTQYFRVHYWKKWFHAVEKSADVLLGQESLEQSGANQYLLKPKAYTLNWVYDALFDNHRNIYVADTGNSRVLRWDGVPKENSSAASQLFGQENFEDLGENKNSIMGIAPYLYWPFGVAHWENTLAVCETGNNRIFFYKT